jgi:AcrR family transcriptional regulator
MVEIMASSVPDVKSQVTDEALVHRRRGQIVAAAVELFSNQGYYRTTIQDVARKAGVSSGLIYQYVSDKEDVLLLSLLSVLESYKQEIPAALEGLTDPLERCWAAIDAYCRVVDQRREATVLAYRSTKSLPDQRRELIKASELETNELIAACLRDCIAKGLFRDVNVELVTYHLVTFAHTWALKHWRLKDLSTLEEYINQGFDFFAQALLTPKGWRHYSKFIEARGNVLAPRAAAVPAAPPADIPVPKDTKRKP